MSREEEIVVDAMEEDATKDGSNAVGCVVPEVLLSSEWACKKDVVAAEVSLEV